MHSLLIWHWRVQTKALCLLNLINLIRRSFIWEKFDWATQPGFCFVLLPVFYLKDTRFKGMDYNTICNQAPSIKGFLKLILVCVLILLPFVGNLVMTPSKHSLVETVPCLYLTSLPHHHIKCTSANGLRTLSGNICLLWQSQAIWKH